MLTKLQAGVHDRSGWLRGCRCAVCHQGLLQYSKVRGAALAVLAGRDPASRVPARRARRRVDQLRAAGWSMRGIAVAAGISETTVFRLAHRRLAHVSRISEAALLAVET